MPIRPALFIHLVFHSWWVWFLPLKFVLKQKVCFFSLVLSLSKRVPLTLSALLPWLQNSWDRLTGNQHQWPRTGETLVPNHGLGPQSATHLEVAPSLLRIYIMPASVRTLLNKHQMNKWRKHKPEANHGCIHGHNSRCVNGSSAPLVLKAWTAPSCASSSGKKKDPKWWSLAHPWPDISQTIPRFLLCTTLPSEGRTEARRGKILS